MIVERSIAVYDKEEESLIKDIVIDLPIDFLIGLFQVDRNDDPDFYKVYLVNSEQYAALKELIPGLSEFDFDKVTVYLECFSLD